MGLRLCREEIGERCCSREQCDPAGAPAAGAEAARRSSNLIITAGGVPGESPGGVPSNHFFYPRQQQGVLTNTTPLQHQPPPMQVQPQRAPVPLPARIGSSPALDQRYSEALNSYRDTYTPRLDSPGSLATFLSTREVSGAWLMNTNAKGGADFSETRAEDSNPVALELARVLEVERKSGGLRVV